MLLYTEGLISTPSSAQYPTVSCVYVLYAVWYVCVDMFEYRFGAREQIHFLEPDWLSM